jgi:hypothetical protein
MSNEEFIDYFTKKVESGEMTFDQIRPALMRDGLQENDIKLIVRAVDDNLLNKLASSDLPLGKRFIVLGIVLIIIGLIVTIASYSGLFRLGSSSIVIIAYGPIIIGIAMIFVVVRRRLKQDSRRFSVRNGLERRQEDNSQK